jgi:predicted flap endonuclease-1-like 5' DNA nuclease
VSRFADVADWDDAAIDRIDAQLGRFQGRIRRDDWVGQARLLAAGDEGGFADKYGRLD